MLDPQWAETPKSKVASGTESPIIYIYIYGKRSCITVHHKFDWIQTTKDKQATTLQGNYTNCNGYLGYVKSNAYIHK